MLQISIAYAGLLIWLSAIAQHANNLASHGNAYVMSDRSKQLPDDGFTGRSARALRNNMESALMYVPVAVVTVLQGHSSWLISAVALVYMVVRTTFTLGYWLPINPIRSLSWLIGMICIAVLAGNLVYRGFFA
ncbi:MAPEG family protein [Bradyrhizobium genosp. P]|uniref:MAPEG family protein n=1 Tax=Bradyrhizobium genosp. P TaxID=83641 RepID=UPI003CF72FF6